MRLLFTIFAPALAQQPKIRRTLLSEIADYGTSAAAMAYADEAAQVLATVRQPAVSSPRVTGRPSSR